jgi:hypothetical protein
LNRRNGRFAVFLAFGDVFGDVFVRGLRGALVARQVAVPDGLERSSPPAPNLLALELVSLRCETYDDSEPLTGSDEALGLVDFSVFPHLDREDMPATPLPDIERWAAGLSVPAYAIDDQTAIRVVDGTVEVVSEGHWKLFTPSPEAS